MGLCRAQRGSSAPGRGRQDPPSEGAGGAEPPLPPQDYISLFPLDDTQPSKLMRLLSSNEEDANILSSPSKCGQRRGVVVPRDGSVLVSGGKMCIGTKTLLFPSWPGEDLECSGVFC